ncbi:hypothetical protein [Paraburkholderia sp. GAS42]
MAQPDARQVAGRLETLTLDGTRPGLACNVASGAAASSPKAFI